MDFFPRRKFVARHLVPSTYPFNVFALGKDDEVAVSLTDTAIAVLDGDVPAFLLGQIRMGKLEAHGTLLGGRGCLDRQMSFCKIFSFPSCLEV